ncbi:hypothetical protein ACIQRJ_17710 [Streptomyces niveus]|uniref:hypothetical protein n=1 Tax=Streptomyces niveus TaxID=193462 RepID=UPI003837662B
MRKRLKERFARKWAISWMKAKQRKTARTETTNAAAPPTVRPPRGPTAQNEATATTYEHRKSAQ